MAMSPTAADSQADDLHGCPSPTLFPDDRVLTRLTAQAADAASDLQHFFGAYRALEALIESKCYSDDKPLELHASELFVLISSLNRTMAEHVRHAHQACHRLHGEMGQRASKALVSQSG